MIFGIRVFDVFILKPGLFIPLRLYRAAARRSTGPNYLAFLKDGLSDRYGGYAIGKSKLAGRQLHIIIHTETPGARTVTTDLLVSLKV